MVPEQNGRPDDKDVTQDRTPADDAPLPPEKRSLHEREKRTLPMRRVYMIVLAALILVIVAIIIS